MSDLPLPPPELASRVYSVEWRDTDAAYLGRRVPGARRPDEAADRLPAARRLVVRRQAGARLRLRGRPGQYGSRPTSERTAYWHRGSNTSASGGLAIDSSRRRAWTAAKLRRIGLHEARHTFASYLIAAQVQAGRFNPKAIQKAMGHLSIQVTYDRYGKLFSGSDDETRDLLDAYLAAAVRGGA